MTAYARSEDGTRLRQGEVIGNIVQHIVAVETLGGPEPIAWDVRAHPFAIVVSQDCDLEQDFEAKSTLQQLSQIQSLSTQQLRDRQQAEKAMLPAILLCEVQAAEEAFKYVTGSDIKKRIRYNKDERYQFLAPATAEFDGQNLGMPELVIDFKRFFTMPSMELYVKLAQGAQRRSYLRSPYAEHLSARFYQFQSRIALELQHHDIVNAEDKPKAAPEALPADPA